MSSKKSVEICDNCGRDYRAKLLEECPFCGFDNYTAVNREHSNGTIRHSRPLRVLQPRTSESRDQLWDYEADGPEEAEGRT